MEYRPKSFKDEIHEDFHAWKNSNPDWRVYLENPASLRDTEQVRMRRRQIYQGIASLQLTALQRQLNVRRLPPNPNRGHWEEFIVSEAMTVAQHTRGQHLPFHEQMEHFLSHVFEAVDSHFGYRGADSLAHVKEHIETWFETHVRRPAAQALASHRNEKRRW